MKQKVAYCLLNVLFENLMEEMIDLLWFTSLVSPGAESSGFPDSSLALPDPAGAVDEETAAPPRIASSPPAPPPPPVLSSMSASPASPAAGRLEVVRTVFLFLNYNII